MRMQKRKFRIGDLAQRLNVDRFVIRFWEKEFNLKSTRSQGGQRFYEEKDFEKFKKIKTLLYSKKFTIAGAKKELISNPENTSILASQKTTFNDIDEINKKNFLNNILTLRKQLLELRKLL